MSESDLRVPAASLVAFARAAFEKLGMAAEDAQTAAEILIDDAEGGFGLLVAVQAMALAIGNAQQVGVGAVALRNSSSIVAIRESSTTMTRACRIASRHRLKGWASTIKSISRRKSSSTWLAFARTGHPNHDGIPHLPPYSSDRRPMMIFHSHTNQGEVRVTQRTDVFLCG